MNLFYLEAIIVEDHERDAGDDDRLGQVIIRVDVLKLISKRNIF